MVAFNVALAAVLEKTRCPPYRSTGSLTIATVKQCTQILFKRSGYST